MWRVLVSKAADRKLSRSPEQVRRKFEAWRRTIEVMGPGALRDFPSFHDEALLGEWKGYRSSRLNLQYRVIYRVVGEKVEVHVMEVTAHDYRRKG